MTGWPEVALGPRCEVFSGYPFKSAHFTDDPDDIALVKGENVGQGEILWSISKRWPRVDVDNLARFRLEPRDVVLAMDRPWVPAGLKFARISEADPQALLVQRVARLRAIADLDQRFLYYLIGSSEFVAYVKNVGRGVGVPHISGRQIGEFRFRLPRLTTQVAIADILSAYDDLIDNNRRRMALLEEAARQLYREWFVRLRFPGHEHTRITNGVPQGWERAAIGSAFETVLGGTPSRARAEFWEGGTVPWINSGKVNELRVSEPSEWITDQALASSAAKLMPRGTTVLAITGATLGQVSMLEIDCAANQSVVGIVDSSGVRSEIVYLTLRHRIAELVARATGGAQVHINKDIVNAFEVLLPSARLSALFQDHVGPMFRQLAVLLLQNQRLCSARDLLLPRLMNGEIEV